MGVHVLVQLGLFLALVFIGLGVLLAGLGIMKWGNGQEKKHSDGTSGPKA
ncbi:MAG: hypothetical protein GYB25_08895 [Rhodobacteraceae bacterium]|nr:hypothetical protein [Paracoccaceae bacterium]